MPYAALARRPHSPAVSRLAHDNERLSTRLANFKAKGEVVTHRLMQTAEVAAGAGIAGFVAGKYGAIELVGVPLDLVAGLALNLAAHTNLGGKQSEHLHHVGDGFLAMYVGTLMRGVGTSSNAPAVPGV